MALAQSQPGRAHKYLRRGLYAVGGLLGMVVLLVLGLLVSLRFAKVRGYVVAQVNSTLADSFKGRLTIHGVQRIGLGGIVGAEAELFDPAGRRVLDVHGLDVSLSIPSIAWAAVAQKSKPLTIRLTAVELRHVEVVLIDDGAGAPTLADAFEPRTPSPPSSGPGTTILIDRAELQHVWAHGTLASTPPLDAELKAAVASLRSAPDVTAIAFQCARIAARGLPQGVDPSGELQGSLNIPAAVEKSLGAHVHYRGSIAGIQAVLLDASYVDSKVLAHLSAENIPSSAVEKQVPGLQLRSPASLSASAQGQLPALHGTFALGVGAGKLDGDFDLLLKDDLSARANLRAKDLDASELSRDAPASKLGFTLHAALTMPRTGPATGDLQLVTEPSVIAGQALPAVSLTGHFSNDSRTHQARLDAHAGIAEPGAQTVVDATVDHAQHTSIQFRSQTRLENPERAWQFTRVRGRGEVRTQGTYQLEEQQINADVSANLSEVAQGENHLARAKLQAHLAGVLPHPNADVRLDIWDANIAGQHIADAELAARGSLSRLALSAEIAMLVPRRHIQLSAIASNQRGILLDHPSLNLNQAGANLTLSAKRIEVVAGRTTVDNLHLAGAGSADASFAFGRGLERATVDTYQLDLARLWKLVDGKAPLRSGTATLSLRFAQQSRTPSVELHVRAENLGLNRVSGGSLQAELALENGHLDATAQANLKQLGQLKLIVLDLRGIDAANPDPARMSGKLTLEGQLQLRDLSELVPAGSDLPIARARGSVKYDAIIERGRPGAGLPSLHVHLRTQDLQLAGARRSKINLTTKQEALDAAPTAIKGLDFEIDLQHAESGETELTANLRDQIGPLGSLSVEAKAAPTLATVGAELARTWRQIPVRVQLSVPPRELQQLPVDLRPAGLSGVVSGALGYSGTPSAPSLDLSGKLEHFRQTDVRGRGLDLAWQGGYSGAHGSLKANAQAGGREVGKADLDFETAIQGWLERGTGPMPALTGSARVDFDEFPIALLPGTQTSQVDGALSGKIELKDFGKNASLDTKLEARPFKVGQTEFARITTDVLAKEGQARISLRVEDRKGITTADAHSGFSWGSKMVPVLVLPADATLQANAFRLAALAPFVASSFGELDGRVNGALNAHFRGGAPALDGHIDIDQGAAQLVAVGQRFDQIQGRITLVPGKVKLERLSAHATSGKLSATAEANFAGLDLTDAEAHVRISKADAIAVAVAGTDIGDCWGAVDVKMQPGNAERSGKVAVTIPELHVHIPDTGSQDVQGLDPAKDIRVGTQQRSRNFVTLPLQPLTDSEPSKNDRPMIVDLSLGKEVWIFRGDSTKVQLSGKTQLTLGDPATMTGQIELRGGKLDVSGKQFEIESGTVTFSGEPGNPTIVATARWDAPDDEQHRVYADYSGTVKKGKILLRSEPPLTTDQVLSLLLTGSADGSLGGSSNGGGSTAATAVGAVGGAATQGLNKALSSISALDVSTRVDTSTGSARPELVVQISPKVSAALTRALGTPAPGQPPDLTFLTFEFRIRSRWSLSALVGDRGESGLDLIWRRRY